MSAFLGPIHHTMYQKILLQDGMSETLLALAEAQGFAPELREQVDAAAPASPNRPLEEIITADNIHGWLARAVSGCETRFALTATALLDNHPERMVPVTRALAALGTQHPVSIDGAAPAAFHALTSLLLDGMPCDRPFAVHTSQEDRVEWAVSTCPHTPYWQNPAVNADTFYTLRASLVDAMLADSGFVYTQNSKGAFTLTKEEAV